MSSPVVVQRRRSGRWSPRPAIVSARSQPSPRVTGSLFAAVAFGAASVGSLHTLAPDHWVPFAALARARGWSSRRTARVTLLCGFGHVTASALLGLIGLFFGVQMIQRLGTRMEAASGILLIGFGVAYAIW